MSLRVYIISQRTSCSMIRAKSIKMVYAARWFMQKNLLDIRIGQFSVEFMLDRIDL
jgi:hypothetical protein